MIGKVISKAFEKPTSFIHILCGIITVLGAIHFGWWVAPLGFIVFLIIEIWTEKEWKESQDDFWEYAFGIFATLGVLLARVSKTFLVVALLLLLVWVILDIRRYKKEVNK